MRRWEDHTQSLEPMPMAMRESSGAALVALALWSASGALTPAAGGQPVPAAEQPVCTLDLSNPGKMKDVVSNALRQGLDVPEKEIRAFLVDAEKTHDTGAAVVKAAAAHFKLDEAVLAAEVERFRHINCRHPGGGEYREPGRGGAGGQLYADVQVTPFARDVTLHVVLHELGHALIREFDIPVLGNEETVADAFATYYLTTCMPDRALDVLKARTTSLMIEAGEGSQPVDWGGEHDHDARRANQIAALAVAADPLKYRPVADIVGMSDDDFSDAKDYGSEIRRSWRRVLTPLWMPDGAKSPEARVVCDESAFIRRLCAPVPDAGLGLAAEIEDAVRRFDWHSQVTVRFADSEGGAAWSRGNRTITVNASYVRRFVDQGARGLPGKPVSVR